jgi:5-methylcytosine-specific restriction protein A
MEYRTETSDRRLLHARIDAVEGVVTLHSRGGSTGGKPPRNEGYAEALIAICERASSGSALESVLLDSAPARRLPKAQRVLISRAEIETLDGAGLAKTIRTRMRRFGQAKGVTGGNSTKQIRFEFSIEDKAIIDLLRLKAADTDGLDSDGFLATVAGLPEGEFSTADFIVEYRTQHPAEWSFLEQRHGVGGKGAGQHRTVFTHVAHRLSALAKRGELQKLDYRPAPDWWGNGVVRYWRQASSEPVSSIEIIAVDQEYREGSLRLKSHLRRERHWGLAKKKKAHFIAAHGKLICQRCNLIPSEALGAAYGDAVIEVHHASVAVSAMTPDHRTTLSDLQCLCANCHRLVHAEMSGQRVKVSG